MSDVWLVVLLTGAASIGLRAVGPVALAGRRLPARLAGPVEVLAPAVLAALVVTQSISGDRELVLDERLVGVGVAVLAVLLRAPLLAIVVFAALATAVVRAL